MSAILEEYRPRRISKPHRQVILMPKWGVERVILRDTTITLPRISILDGFEDTAGTISNLSNRSA